MCYYIGYCDYCICLNEVCGLYDGEMVSFDASLGFMVIWVCVKVNLDICWCDAIYGYICYLGEITYYVKIYAMTWLKLVKKLL